MSDDTSNFGMTAAAPLGLPPVVDRSTFEAEVDELRLREKAHTHEGDALAAARRRLPMVEVDGSLELTGPDGPTSLLDAFGGRRQLIAYYFMWHTGHPAAEQCEGCTYYTTQISELSHLHSRGITYAVLCQGPYEESIRYHDFMDWKMPWYSAQDSLSALLTPPKRPGMMHIVCYMRDGSRVFETYWTTLRGVRGIRLQLRPYGPHRLRTPGALGGLAPRLAATVHLHPNRRRSTTLATRADLAGGPPDRTVVPSGSWAVR